MSVIGTWALTLNSPLGDQAARLDIQELEGACQGTLTGKGDPSPLERLTVDGNNLSFSAFVDTPVGRMNLAFTGAVTDGAIAGTYSTPFGAFQFSGNRPATA
jgi:hypothetical protein